MRYEQPWSGKCPTCITQVLHVKCKWEDRETTMAYCRHCRTYVIPVYPSLRAEMDDFFQPKGDAKTEQAYATVDSSLTLDNLKIARDLLAKSIANSPVLKTPVDFGRTVTVTSELRVIEEIAEFTQEDHNKLSPTGRLKKSQPAIHELPRRKRIE